MPGSDIIVKVGADITGFKSGIHGMSTEAHNVSRIVTRSLLAIGAAFTTVSVIGAKFEQTLIETATVAGAFGDELKALEIGAREMGKTTSFSATEVAKSYYDLASSGMQVNEIIAAGESALKLATATNSEAAQATNLLASSINQFGLKATDASHVSDIFMQSINKSLLTMDKMTIAMRYAGATGSALKWSLEETTAAVAMFANMGLTGEIAGTNLRSAMAHLTRQTDESAKVLDDLKMTYEDINPVTHSFGEILKAISKNSLDAEQAIKLFGVESGLNMARLIEKSREGKLGYEEFVKMLEKSSEGAGATAAAYDRMMDTFQNQWKLMLNNLKELALVIFDTFKESGKDMFTDITQSIQRLSKSIVENKETLSTMFTIMAETIKISVSASIIIIEELITVIKGLKREVMVFIDPIIKLINLMDEWGKKQSEISKQEFINDESVAMVGEATKKYLELRRTLGQVPLDFEAITTAQVENIAATKLLYDTTNHALERVEVFNKTQEVSVEKTTKVVNKLYAGIDDLLKAWDSAAYKAEIWYEDQQELNEAFEDAAYWMNELKLGTDSLYEDRSKQMQDAIKDQQELNILLEQMAVDGLDNQKAWRTYWADFKLGIKKSTEGSINFHQKWYDFGEKLHEEMGNAFGDSFYAIVTGKFESIEDAWTGMMDNLLKYWTDTLGDMVAKWAMENPKMGFGAMAGIGLGMAAGSMAYPRNSNAQTGAAIGSTIGTVIGSKWGPVGAAAGGALGGLGGSWLGSLWYEEPEKKAKIQRAELSYDRDIGSQISDYVVTGYKFNAKHKIISDSIETLRKNIDNSISAIPPELRVGFEREFEKRPISLNGTWTKENIDKMMLEWEDRTREAMEKTAKALGYETLDAYQEYIQKFEGMSIQSASMIGDAFRRTIDTDVWSSFEDFTLNLKENIYESVKTGLIEAFMNSEVFRSAIRPFIDKFQQAVENATTSEGVFDPTKFHLPDASKIDFESLQYVYDNMANYLRRLNMMMGTDFGVVEARAKGGSVYRGKKYIVGENGPEEFIPSENGYINPNSGNQNLVFVNNGVLTESEFFKQGMRSYQDLRKQDSFKTNNISSVGIRALS